MLYITPQCTPENGKNSKKSDIYGDGAARALFAWSRSRNINLEDQEDSGKPAVNDAQYETLLIL